MKLFLIGGFLGSGKTTAIVNACQHLIKKDQRVAVITNDQGDQQVDMHLSKALAYQLPK
jgi:G3E family GTPase